MRTPWGCAPDDTSHPAVLYGGRLILHRVELDDPAVLGAAMSAAGRGDSLNLWVQSTLAAGLDQNTPTNRKSAGRGLLADTSQDADR